MSNIRIISISNPKTNPYIIKTREYLKWISKYSSIELVDINTKSNNKTDLLKETNIAFKNKINSSAFSILLDVKGKELDSQDFANNIIKLNQNSANKIDFYIPGAYGLLEIDKANFNSKLSLSKMTLPHDLAKLMLAEQIYRAYTILNNKAYHY